MKDNAWPEDLQAKLIQLWNDGFNSRQIGMELGFGRNAVIGKLWRLRKKYPERFLPARLPQPRPKPKKRRLVRRQRCIGARIPMIAKVKPPSPTLYRPEEGMGVPLLDIASNGCRFIVSTQNGRVPTHLYCGTRVPGLGAGDPPPECYCDYHRVLMGRCG